MWIRLDWRDDHLGLEVVDDGRGGGPGHEGHGIVGMRERVGAIGGALRAGPGPDGTGFRVTATLPVDTHG